MADRALSDCDPAHIGHAGLWVLQGASRIASQIAGRASARFT
jgi:hypothetical protein